MGWIRHFTVSNDIKILLLLNSIVFISSVFGRYTVLAFLSSLIFLFLLFNHLYLKYIGRMLEFEVDKSKIKLFQGDYEEITLTLRQNSRLPILNANLRVSYDTAIEMEGGKDVFNSEQSLLMVPFSVGGRQSFEVKLPFTGVRRGVTRIRRVEILIFPFFGFGTLHLENKEDVEFEVIVYPRELSVARLDKIVSKNTGNFRTNHSYFEDTTAIIGAREYVSSDSFNRIHWKATARTSALQTKVFEQVIEYSWTIIVDIREDELEESLSGVRYLLEYATSRNIPFELFINVRMMGRIPYLHLSMGSGKVHLQKALEVLARVDKRSVTIPFHQLLYLAGRNHQLSPFVILVGQLQDHDHMLLNGLARNGAVVYQLLNQGGTLYLANGFKQRVVNEHAI